LKGDKFEDKFDIVTIDRWDFSGVAKDTLQTVCYNIAINTTSVTCAWFIGIKILHGGKVYDNNYMVRPTLEYCNSIWPSFILDQRKIEKVQRRATRLLPFFEDKLNCRSKYFFNRLVNDWNNLPSAIVNTNSVNKSLLDNYL